MCNDSCFFRNRTLANLARKSLPRLAIFSLLWYALTGADKASWLIGIPAVLFVSALSQILASSSSLNIFFAGLLRFIPFFLYQSFHGGFDVMRRALSFQREYKGSE